MQFQNSLGYKGREWDRRREEKKEASREEGKEMGGLVQLLELLSQRQ